MIARSEKRSSEIVDLVQVLILSMSKKDRSASALLIGRVHAMRRRRWMFGKASTSHTPSAGRRSPGSSFSADCRIIYHLRSPFPRDLGNGRSFSQNNMSSVASDSSRVFLTMIECRVYCFYWLRVLGKASDGRGGPRQTVGLEFE